MLNNGVDELLAGTLTQIRLRNKAAAEAMKQNNFLSLSQTQCVQVGKDCSLVGGGGLGGSNQYVGGHLIP